MKKESIVAGASYTNASGRAERRVLAIGADIPVRWFGDDATEPKGELVVRYVDTRMGKTVYEGPTAKPERTMYISAFASWARQKAGGASN
jgi:hypothetical protein